MAITANKKFWTEFINIYHSLPSLWNTKDDKYNNRECRSAAWNKLVEKLQEVETVANQDSVKRKINTFRSNFNREVRKIRQAQRDQGVDQYTPSLWYFDHLSFLLYQDKNNGGPSIIGEHYEEETTASLMMGHATKSDILHHNELSTTVDGSNFLKGYFTAPSNDYAANQISNKLNPTAIKQIKLESPAIAQNRQDNLEYATLTNVEEVMDAEDSSSAPKELTANSHITAAVDNDADHEKPEEQLVNHKSKKIIRSSLNKKTKLRLKSQNSRNTSRLNMACLDEAGIYGQSWACGFRKLSPEQKFYAKKAIDEILILGQLNKLKLQTIPADPVLLESVNLPEKEKDYIESLNKNS